MWFSGLNNHFYDNVRAITYDKKKILFSKLQSSNKFILRWENPTLWGKKFNDKEFVDLLTEYLANNKSIETNTNTNTNTKNEVEEMQT